jgi:flagellar hook protein FlgE
MSLTGSFYTALSGLSTNGTAMGIVGDNISNVNTSGFKSSSAHFEDVLGLALTGVLGGNQTGAGTNIQTVDVNFVQGTFQNTDVSTDVAINGKGFFILKDPYTNEKFYTRAGHFHFDQSGYYINNEGKRVQGYLYDSTGTDLIEALADIRVDQNSMIAPNATTAVEMNLNLDSSEDVYAGSIKSVTINAGGAGYAVGDVLTIVQSGGNGGTVTVTAVDGSGAVTGISLTTAGGNYKIEDGLSTTGGTGSGFKVNITNLVWDITDPVGSSHYSTPVTIYDTLGQSHVINVHFTKTETNTWQWHAVIDASEVLTADTDLDGDVETPTGDYVLYGSGETTNNLIFNTSGVLISPATAIDFYDSANHITFANGVPATATTIDFTATTQYGASSNIQSIVQDGYAAGTASGVAIDDSGNIIANYTNGQVKKIARLALSTFLNLNGLLRKGSTLYMETPTSGLPIINKAGEGGLGTISAAMLEESNVDIAGEIIKMIVVQRAYQANAKVVSATDEMMNTLVNIR